MNKYHYIYLITNLINSKMYIGKRTCKCRIQDDSYMGSGVHLSRAKKKYGIENFSKLIIEVCDSEEKAFEREKYWIAKYNARENIRFYNLTDGGEGVSAPKTDEWKRKKSLSMLGKTHSESTRRKIGEAQKGKILSDEHRKKISKNHGMAKQAIIIIDGETIIRNTRNEICDYLYNDLGIKTDIHKWFKFDKNGVPKIAKKWLSRI